MTLTLRQAHKAVRYKKLPLGAVASCPCCRESYATLRKPYNWGDVEKAKALVAAHIIEAHPELETR